jgi:hypothetical protein
MESASQTVDMWWSEMAKLLKRALPPDLAAKLPQIATARDFANVFCHNANFLDRDACLLVDEFDVVARLPPEIRTDFLAVLRDMKNGYPSTYVVRAVIATGRFAATSVNTEIGSPFNVQLTFLSPPLSLENTYELFGQLETQMGLTLAAGVVEDICMRTGGNHGLTNALGLRLMELLDTNPELTLSNWLQEVSSVSFLESLLELANVKRMLRTANKLGEVGEKRRTVLFLAFAGLSVPRPSPEDETEVIEPLLTDGLLVQSERGLVRSSPLVAELVMSRLRRRRGLPEQNVPLLESGEVDQRKLLRQMLPFLHRSAIVEGLKTAKNEVAERVLQSAVMEVLDGNVYRAQPEVWVSAADVALPSCRTATGNDRTGGKCDIVLSRGSGADLKYYLAVELGVRSLHNISFRPFCLLP